MIPLPNSNSNHTSNNSSSSASNSSFSWGTTPATRRLPAVLTRPTITTETSSSLEEIIRQYNQKPELLELILMSKVQEDRRRAEEAKLRSKEIDYILQREQQRPSSTSSSPSPPSPDMYHHHHHHKHHSHHHHIHESHHQQHRHSLPSLPAIMDLDKKVSVPYRSPSLTSSSFGSPRSTPEQTPVAATSPSPQHPSREELLHPTALLHPTTANNDRLLPTIMPISSSSPERPTSPVVSASQEIRQLIASRKRLSNSGAPTNEPYPYGNNKNNNNNNHSINSPSFSTAPVIPNNYHQSEKRHSFHEDEQNHSNNAQQQQQQQQQPNSNKTHIYHYYYGPTAPPNKLPLPPAPQPIMTPAASQSSSLTPGSNTTTQSRPFAKRRRREMQAITMIIETREFPYNDDYLWKNNGNTIHKGSGNKSIYYKCANNQKGCPVNKTVTFKDNGEYLIKYRGKHLSDCSRIKRVVDV